MRLCALSEDGGGRWRWWKSAGSSGRPGAEDAGEECAMATLGRPRWRSLRTGEDATPARAGPTGHGEARELTNAVAGAPEWVGAGAAVYAADLGGLPRCYRPGDGGLSAADGRRPSNLAEPTRQHAGRRRDLRRHPRRHRPRPRHGRVSRPARHVGPLESGELSQEPPVADIRAAIPVVVSPTGRELRLGSHSRRLGVSKLGTGISSLVRVTAT